MATPTKFVTTGGTDRNDKLVGSAAQDSISGGAGNDSLFGGDGNDALYGGTGNDYLDGGSGDDTLAGGSGADTLYGGSGMDYLDYSASAAGVLVDLSTGQALYGDAQGDRLAGDDGLIGSGYADTLVGFDGQGTSGDVYTNVFYGNAGNDSLDGKGGDDQLYGGSDNDTVLGGSGNDLVQGDAGADSLYGGDGADGVYGGTEADTVYGDAGTDRIFGGDGSDIAFGGTDADYLSGDAGSDALYGDGGSDTLYGGTDADRLFGGADNDSLSGDAGSDSLSGDAGADTLSGGAGNDTLFSGSDADSLSGDSGMDSLSGGTGVDVLAGGIGNDTLTGGEGSDTFSFDNEGGSDLVTGFDMSDETGHTANQLDISELTNRDGSPVKAWDVKVSRDENGNAVLNFPEGEPVALKGVSPEWIGKVGGLAKMGVPCFTSGTRLAVPGCWRAVEDLGLGDLVLTPTGAVPVIWHGMRALDAAALEAHAEQRPIRLKAGHHGLTRDLIVLPQPAVALGGALIRARHLAEWGKGAHVAKGMGQVTYHHLLLPRHALVQADGAWTESFYPGVEALRMLKPSDRVAVARAILGPRRDDGDGDLAGIYGPRCLPLLTGHAARERLATGVIAA